ncbi:MAG: gluconokinase [Subtercola sp.]|nr:gluconokinase [Subtercola sp.]
MTPLIVVAGVSGAGKSTIGLAVAEKLGIPFADADSLHSAENVAKMAGGTPLTDEDRAPWLLRIGSELQRSRNDGLVLACSALRRRYRDTIREAAPDTFFITLTGSRELLESRIGARRNHFMSAALLDSQLAAFEPLDPDERGVSLTIDADVPTIVARAVAAATATQ